MSGVDLAYQADAAAPAAAGILEVRGLDIVYSSKRGDVAALEALDLSLGRGEFLSVLGPSGCGKSTLLKAAAGLLKANRGELLLNGKPVEGPRREAGVVFQQPMLLPWLTVMENVLLPIRNLGLDLKQGRRRAEELLELTRISDFARHYPPELSGGMQQRVGIARSLVHEPDLLLMDEPFAALDAMTREKMMLELQRIWQATNSSVLFITHSVPEAVFLSDRVVVLSDRPGRIVRELPVDLPRPRSMATMAEPAFGEMCTQLRATLSENTAL